MNADLINQIHFRHENTPGKTYGAVFAETWYPHVAEWWKGEYKGSKTAWTTEDLKLPTGWTYNVETAYVHNKGKYRNLFWLYGVSNEPLHG